MTYEYTCLACHHEWEAEQSISAKPLTECPQCHESTAKRMVSGGAGFILKGGGWYADGYGSKGGATKTDSGKDSTASSATPASDSTEKKDTKKAGETSASASDSTGKTAST